MVILHTTSMIRELPSSGPTSCLFHALLGVHSSFSWSFIIHHVPSLSIVHHLIYIYIHICTYVHIYMCTYVYSVYLILLTTSIIHHPIRILIYHPPSTSDLIVRDDVWHNLETGWNPSSSFDTFRILEGSRKVCSSCPLLHLGCCQRCLLII